ncbi:low molecular weight phosphatase family protein [Candidatus Woesearchaeota archaeon]|nr:low molecular weight phosphatase family protein [Candidatus Woesearchaeota archaeon]
MKILFVCSGNVGRSQMAETFFNSLTQHHHAISAGIRVGVHEGKNLAKYEHVVKCMQDVGFSVAHKVSRQLTEQMVKESDKIISFAAAEELPEYARNSGKIVYWDVADAKGMDYSFHCKIRDQIKELVESLINELD